MWLKVWLMRLFRVPVSMSISRIEIKGSDTVPEAEQLRAMSAIFNLIPGLQDDWMRALNQVIEEMAKVPADEKGHGRRIQLCQRAVDLWQCLQMHKHAAAKYNQIHQQIAEDKPKAQLQNMVM